MNHKWFDVLSFVILSLAFCSQVRGRLVTKHEYSTVDSENYHNETYHGGRISAGIKEPISAASFGGLQTEKYDTHWAIYQTKDSSGPFYGSKVQLNIYGSPNTNSKQASASFVLLSSGVGDHSDAIQAGWQVHPAIYHDSDAHFFVFWAADGNKRGCFDLLCEGFVLDKSAKMKPGYRPTPVSEYDGPQRYFTLRIQKNLDTGDWWLYRDDSDVAGPVGYWPKSLFTSLADSASIVQWGGIVRSVRDQFGPSMGSGHFSSEGEGKAAYIKNIKVVNSIGDLYTAIKSSVVSSVDRPFCYDVGEYKDSNGSGGSDGYAIFYYGGPGCND